MPTNPVLTTHLPYTLPDFAAATPADYRRAIEAGMAAQRAGLDRLRDDTAAPTVENVLGAWDDAEATLRRALNAFYAVHASDRSPELDAIDEEMSPRLAELKSVTGPSQKNSVNMEATRVTVTAAPFSRKMAASSSAKASVRAARPT